MGGEVEQAAAFDERLTHQPYIAVFEIPQPAVNQSRRFGGRSRRKVVRVDQHDRHAIQCQLARHRRAVNPSPQDEDRLNRRRQGVKCHERSIRERVRSSLKFVRGNLPERSDKLQNSGRQFV